MTETTPTEEELDYKVLPADFYYESNSVDEPPARSSELPRDVLALDSSFGFDSGLRNNLHYVGDPEKPDDVALLFATGNCVHILKVATGQVSYLFGHNTGGIGSLTVHPSRNFFAVGEKGPNPHVIIYEYPSLRTYRILRNGTEAAYSDLDFSHTGNQLASVGSAPDYMLTVWDWKNERIILRTKAFAQEVYNVKFSPYDEGKLTTSGMGHIRFWKMAKTFTGLKLQGDIGKFGKFDLSDVSAFSEYEDGKVLSGSEIGQLLLWEGNFIKIEVGRPNGGLAHDGEIHYVKVDVKNNWVVTAGDDGAVRFWSYEAIEVAEASDEQPRLELVRCCCYYCCCCCCCCCARFNSTNLCFLILSLPFHLLSSLLPPPSSLLPSPSFLLLLPPSTFFPGAAPRGQHARGCEDSWNIAWQ